MLARVAIKRLVQITLIGSITWMLGACFQPPFNNFKSQSMDFGDTETCGSKKILHSRAERNTIARNMIRKLGTQHIQFIQRGDRMTIIVPTDRYYFFNTPDLNDVHYQGLNDVATLIKLFPCSRINVAAFGDNVGKNTLKYKLTKARAEAMITFLWAKGIPAQLLTPEGYGDKFPIGDNRIVHGSAYNRRIEIQWWTGKNPPSPSKHIPAAMKTK